MGDSPTRLLKVVDDILRGKRSVALYSNAFYITTSGAVTALLSFGFWIAATRYYSPSEVGQAKALLSAAALIASLSSLGLPIGLIRFLPLEENKREMINTCLSLSAICAFLGVAIFMAGLPFWSPSLLFVWQDKVALVSFLVLVLVICFLSLQSNIFLSLHRVQFSALQQILGAALKIPLAIILAFWGTMGLFHSWVISFLVTFLVALFLLFKLESSYYPRPSLNKRVIKKIVPFSLGNYIADLTGVLPANILPLLVIGVLGAEPNAYFSIGYVLAGALFLFVNAVATSLFAEGSHEPEGFHHNLIRSLKLMSLLLLPGIAIMFLLGDKILLIFGSEYSQNSFEILRLFSLAAIPMAINEIYIQINRLKLAIKPMVSLYLCVTIITVGLGYFLMPRMGLTGVGIGWLVGQALPAIFTCKIVFSQAIRRT